MAEDKDSKVIALWLSTGKKLDTTLGSIITDQGLLVRESDIKVLIVPKSHVVAIECIYYSKEALDKVFNG